MFGQETFERSQGVPTKGFYCNDFIKQCYPPAAEIYQVPLPPQDASRLSYFSDTALLFKELKHGGGDDIDVKSFQLEFTILSSLVRGALPKAAFLQNGFLKKSPLVEGIGETTRVRRT